MKKVIIIGATSGIGRGLAETYINEVHKVKIAITEYVTLPMTMIHFINSIHSLMKWEVWIFW